MAQINITLKINIDEANLLLKLLDEGEEVRQQLGKQFRENSLKKGESTSEWKDGNPLFDRWRRMGQEVLAIEAMRRGMKGAI